MKKLIILHLVLFTCTSCVKEYSCECVDGAGNSIGGGNYNSISRTKALEKCKKSRDLLPTESCKII
jgi:hypothetical protein